MTASPRAWILPVALALSTGCVSMKKYNALDAKYTQVQHENKRLKDQLAARDALAAQRMAEFRELMADFKPLIDKGVLEVEIVDGRVVIGMSADVLFASGSADLSAAGQDNLREVARLLARKPDYEFQVEGHTDDDPISTTLYPNNWYLGASRAIKVVEFLVSNGMSPENLSAASFGQYTPAAPNTTAANKARNRRIELVLLPDLSELPGYNELMEQKDRPARKQRPPKKHPQNR